VLDACAAAVRPGVTTDELDRIAHDVTVAGGGYPSPLNYCSFPKSCCTSVNEVICHGIPDARPLEDGDIVNLDISVFLNGYHGDLNETVLCGSVDDAGQAVVRGAWECLSRAIDLVKPGTRFRDVGDAISAHAARAGLSVVRTYCGHGIGCVCAPACIVLLRHCCPALVLCADARAVAARHPTLLPAFHPCSELFHCAPNIPHYGNNKAVGIMRPGMIFTIEPMINLGSWKDTTWPDGWTSVTIDGKRSAQFEHTMLVTETGVEILTARTPDSPAIFPFA
jgi:methionyl aminopeptidase